MGRTSSPAAPMSARAPGRTGGRRSALRRLRWLAVLPPLLLASPPGFAFNSFLNTWNTVYPASASGDNANCALCHNSFNSGDGFNPYGSAIANAGGSTAERIRAVEGLDSDGDPTGSSNLEEIIADAQPGWTGSAPAGVTGDLDPVVVIAEPNITVAPTTLDFSTVTVSATAVLTVTVENVGDADLNVSGVVLGAGTSTEFSASPSSPFTLIPGGTQNVEVTYLPMDIGDDSGSIEINSDDPDTPTVVVEVFGTGVAPPAPDIALAPAGVDFGTVVIGATGTQTAQIRNVGDASLLITGIESCAGTSGEFTWDALGNLTIPAGGSETLTVHYAPVDEGSDMGCLSIASDDPDENPIEFSVAGTGTLASTPDIALDPAALDFGARTVGDTASLSALIRNAGSADLTVTGIVLSAATSGEFALTAPATPLVIGPGASATVEVAYTPADTGTDTGAVVIDSDDADEPTLQLALSGSGNLAPVPPDINLDPASRNFGLVTIGSSDSLTVAVQNLGGEPLSVTMVSRCAGTSGEFGWSPASFTVPAGSSVDLNVTYTPVDEGLDEGCLAIASNDPDEPTVELGVSGSGQAPQGTADVTVLAPARIEPQSDGVTAVQLFATGADVVVDKLRCGSEGEMPERLTVEDFNDDGFQDTIALFETDELGIACGDTSFVCTGMLTDGTDFTATSSAFETVGKECRRRKGGDNGNGGGNGGDNGNGNGKDNDKGNGKDKDGDDDESADESSTGFSTDASPFSGGTDGSSGGAGSLGPTLPAMLALLLAGRLLRRRRV